MRIHDVKEAFRENENRFRLAFEHAPTAMAFVGPDFRFLKVNAALCRLLGYTEDELKALTFVDITHPEDVAKGVELSNRMVRGEIPSFGLEKRYFTKSGEIVWAEVTVTLVHESNGAFLYSLVMIENLTERERAKAALRESEDRYRDLIENSGVIIGTHDLEGNTLSVNQSFVRAAGYERAEELLSLRISYLLAPDVRHLFPAYLEKIRSDGHARGLMKILTPGGEERILEYDNSVRRKGLATPIVRCFARDVTERKRAEAALLGYPVTDWLEQPTFWLDHLHPEDRRRVLKQRRQAIAEQRDFDLEYRMIAKDGRTVWLRGIVKVVTVHDHCIKLRGITVDITERKRAEQRERESENRYRTLFEKASDAIFIETENDEILEVNQRACDLLGYSRTELLAMKIPELQAPEVRGRTGTVVISELERHQDTPFESLDLHRSGRRIPVEVAKTVIEDQERTLVLSVVRDITERKQLELKRQEQINFIAESETQLYNFARIMGCSTAIQETIKEARKVAAGDVSPILIMGETGVGRGLLARAIHYASRRAPFAFVLIDCPAIPGTLFESELFGHEQGAFTDEISEIPLTLQAKLLQVIQEGTFQRLGGREKIALNARIIAATNRDLRAEVAAGRFRADLYQRLFVVQIDLPPLRERGDDIMMLAEHFIEIYNKKYGKQVRWVTARVAEILRRYTWPGNVRELEHAIERAVFFEEGDEIMPQHLRIELEDVAALHHTAAAAVAQEQSTPSPAQVPTAGGTLDQMKVMLIKQTVEQCGGNISRAARELGISRSRIYRVLQGG